MGECSFNVEGHTLHCRLDFNALRLWAEAEKVEFVDISTRLQNGDFVQLCEFLWHGHRNSCHRTGTIPQMDRQQFLAHVCGTDPEELAEIVGNALALPGE